jgi:hypothetical protein
MTFRTTVLILFSVLSGSNIIAAEQRAAWVLTPAEHVSRRLEARLGPNVRQTGNTVREVDGSRNPELFLSGDLTGILLNSIRPEYLAHSTEMHERLNPWLLSFDWNPTIFWHDLDAASIEYMRLIHEEGHTRRSGEVSRQICGSRIAVLTAMRQKYERFDEFLYRAIAPNHIMTIDDGASAAWLLWVEGGCK